MKKIALFFVLLASPTFAQQQPNQPPPAEYIIPTLQQQRNQMMDRAALAEARAAQLVEENQKLKADLAAKDIKPKE